MDRVTLRNRMAVTFTGYNRPPYMAETLESWSKVRGIARTRVEFHLEPGTEKVVQLARGADFARETEVFVNPSVLGTQRNPFEAMSSAFNHGFFAILAEDDIVVSTDVLEYFSWCEEEFRDDSRVLAVSARQHSAQPGGEAGVRLGDMAMDGTPPMMWVWGTWADRWENLLAPDWTFAYEHYGWDWRIHNHWVKDQGYRIAVPSISRCQHIGEHGGTHCPPGAEFAALQSQCFVSEVEPQQYKLTD